MLFYRHNHMGRVDIKLSCRCIDNPPIGLMRHKPLNILRTDARLRECFLDHFGQTRHRVAEHFPPLHPQMPACSCGGRPAIHIKLVTMSPVGTKHRIQNTPILQRPLAGLRLKNNSSRTIAKQHACRPVGPVKNARKRLRANHQRPFVRARNQKLVGNRQRIDKSRAHRLHVKRRTAMNPECRLHLCRGRGKGIIRRRRCQHDQIDIGRKTPGILDRPFRCARRKHRGRLALGRNMAALDTGPLDNPVIRCIDDFFNVRIGENAFGQVMSAADHN